MTRLVSLTLISSYGSVSVSVRSKGVDLQKRAYTSLDTTKQYSIGDLPYRVDRILNHDYEECLIHCHSRSFCDVTYLYDIKEEYYAEIMVALALLFDGYYNGDYKDGHKLIIELD